MPHATLLHTLMQARAAGADGQQERAGAAAHDERGYDIGRIAAERVAAQYQAALAQVQLGQGAAAEQTAAQALRQAQAFTPREPEAERVLVLMQAEAPGRFAGARRLLEAAAPPATGAIRKHGCQRHAEHRRRRSQRARRPQHADPARAGKR
ncbi:MAG: hypothetical protein U1F49_00545 [Rubrivivax sp.]